MTRRRRFLALVCTLFAFPALALGQSPYAASAPLTAGSPPPISTAPPLAPPPAEVQKATWLEDGPAVRPAGATNMVNDAGWPGGQAGPATSACNFDTPNGGSSWMTTEPSWCQVLAGAYFNVRLGPTIPSFDYVPVSIRQGWYLGNPFGPNWLGTGYWEFVGDLTGAAITSTYGSWFAGMSLMWRYNWVDYGNPVIPYTQFGAGGIFNDAYRNQVQQAVGEQFEFYLHAECGLKCFVAPNLSLDIEGGLQHISNGGLARRNYGVNAVGGQVGFTYYFPWGCH